MLNLNQTCTVTGELVSSIDDVTGQPTYSKGTVMVNQACAFSILSAQQHSESWGDGETATSTNIVSGSLIIPNWAPLLPGALSSYSVMIGNYPGTWRVASARPGAEWNTYLVIHN